MSKWYSETTKLESLAQLKGHRKRKWSLLLVDHGLDYDLYPFWTEEEKALERELWDEADREYQERKSVLNDQLQALSEEDLSTYYNEIGVTP